MECEYDKRKKCDSLYIERYNKILKENEELKKCNKELEEGFKASIEELTDYANRIDKAIEYIEDRFFINEETGEYCLTHTFDDGNLYELMKILKEYKL